MRLTDTAIRNAKPTDKTVKLFDANGLYIEVSPSGSKWWRLKYRLAGKEKRLSLGTYAETSLKVARQRRDAARAFIAEGQDPSGERKAQKAKQVAAANDSFESIARE